MQTKDRTTHGVTDSIGNVDFENWKKGILDLVYKNNSEIKAVRQAFKEEILFAGYSFIKEYPDPRYAMFIGGWSEYFLEGLQDLSAQDLATEDFLNLNKYTLDVLETSSNPIEKILFKSLKKTKHHNRDLEENFDDLMFQYGENNVDCTRVVEIIKKLIGPDKEFFKKVIKHFLRQVFPHLKSLVSRGKFDEKVRKEYGVINEEDMNNFFFCGEFDFYDWGKKHIVELKFWRDVNDKNWEKWFIQAISYVYLINQQYGKEKKFKTTGLTILNTHQGRKWTAEIKDLFGSESSFYRICKLEMPDRSKRQFKKQIQNLYKIYLESSNIDESFVKKHFKFEGDEPTKMMVDFMHRFFESNKQEGKDEFQMGDEKYIWSQWTDWKDKIVVYKI